MLEKLQFKCWKNSTKGLTGPGLKCCFFSIMNDDKNTTASRGRGGVLFLASTLAAIWLSGCATPPGLDAGPRGEASQVPWSKPVAPAVGAGEFGPTRTAPERPRMKAAEERPGLATGFGEQLKSPWNRQSFVRASSSPAGTGVIYYNDKQGIDAMSGYRVKTAGTRKVAGDVLEWGIKGGLGYLPAYEAGYRHDGRCFVVGKRDANYSVVLKNRCKSRLEVVLSVDGLDVIDGKPASFSKRGYVIAPGETLEVKGWRTGPDTVARFKFSTVAGSYANLSRGDHRHVGVIGLAVFTEKGVDPWTWMPREINDRITADPFAKAP
jgi:hypothetical protein